MPDISLIETKTCKNQPPEPSSYHTSSTAAVKQRQLSEVTCGLLYFTNHPSPLTPLTFHPLKLDPPAAHTDHRLPFIFPGSIPSVDLRQTNSLLLSQPENHFTWSRGLREQIQLRHKCGEMSKPNCFAYTPCPSAENPPLQRKVNDSSILSCMY